MQIKIVQDAATRFITENSATVLTAGGVVGTVLTGLVAFRSGMKSERILNDKKFTVTVEEEHELDTLDKVKIIGLHTVAPVALGSLTIAAVVMSHRMSAAKAAALAAAYGVSQKQLDEYKTKMAEKLGVQKMEKAEAEMADEAMQNSKRSPSQVIVVGDNVLVYDRPTDRYFQGSMEQIRTVESKANQEILEAGYYTATEFYNQLGLAGTTWSNDVGWHQPFQLEYSHTLAPDGRPALAINFSKMPQSEYVKDHSRYSP